ncbi:hypothetical protein H4S02_009802 [Coemansia sp. RSA 2611]|nr:hypothetical protein H4S02_009802 [Coemansia sp. RSA 2611]
MRYALSAPTRAAFRRVRVFVDRLLTPPTAHSAVPAVVADAYIKVRDTLVRMGSMITDPAAHQQQR